MPQERAIIIVLDGVGAGELPDADRYGDRGSNTLANTARAVGGLLLPNLQKLGLGNITPIEGVPPTDAPQASWGRMAERSAGKDTTTGHWEMAGIILERPFPTYPHGFPPEIMEPFETKIGRKTLGNCPASGTEIIQRLGEEHIRTGRPIVYTSADSVFQIAAHTQVVPLQELYRFCEIARALLQGPHAVGRVIARPFTGSPGSFTRTADRKDFSLPPPAPTMLEKIAEAGMAVIGVGKINQIFAGRGITQDIHTAGNAEALAAIEQALSRPWQGLLFANLVDFDMLYGHRNDPQGFAGALRAVDDFLPRILAGLGPEDLLLITADHGCDPTTGSTDHSREYAPLLAHRQGRPGTDLGARATFADLGASVLHYLGLARLPGGSSFLPEMDAVRPS